MHIMVFNRRMSERMADYVSAAVRTIDPDAECIPSGATPNSPAYLNYDEPDWTRIPNLQALRATATEAAIRFVRLHPRAKGWL